MLCHNIWLLPPAEIVQVCSLRCLEVQVPGTRAGQPLQIPEALDHLPQAGRMPAQGTPHKFHIFEILRRAKPPLEFHANKGSPHRFSSDLEGMIQGRLAAFKMR